MIRRADDDSDHEDRLDSLLGTYYEALAAGASVDPGAYLREHPEFARELADFFAGQLYLSDMTRPLRSACSSFQYAPVSPLPETLPDDGGETLWDPNHGASPPLEQNLGFTENGHTRIDPGATLVMKSHGPADDDRARSGHRRVRYIGDYELLSVIARGGMGVVYRARQRSLDRQVALKMIRVERCSAADMKRFRLESEAAASLDHPNIVPIFEVGVHQGHQFFSMKLVDGDSLAERIAEFADQPRKAAQVMVTAARAVHHAHERGILHRDLKPSNILLDARGEPHVADFGLAKRLDVDSETTQSGIVIGTPSYMAPEQAYGRCKAITTASDVHGLGAVLYTLLAGRPPFLGDSVLETLEQVKELAPPPPHQGGPASFDPDLELICLKCLEKEPRLRYASANDLADDLQRWLDHRPILARPVSPAERVRLWVRRHPGLAATSAAAILSTAAGLGGVIWQWREAVAARGDLQVALVVAKDNEQAAEKGEDAALRQAYLARMNLASRDWEDANAANVHRLLELTRPAAGRTDLRGFEWYYLNRLDHPRLLAPILDDRQTLDLAFSPDGKLLATADTDRTVRLWDHATGELLRSFPDSQGAFNGLAFSPDGKQLVAINHDRNIRVWDVATGAAVRTINVPNTTLQQVAISPAGGLYATGSSDGVIRIWDSATGEVRQEWNPSPEESPDPDSGVRVALSFSPDGKALASSIRGHLRLRDPATGEVLRTLAEGDGGGVLAFSPDGAMLASGRSREIRLWNPTTGEEIRTLRGDFHRPARLVFRPDGQRLALCGADRAVVIWDPEKPEPIRILRGEGRIAWSLGYSPDGKTLAVGGDAVRLWDAEVDQDARVLTGHQGTVWSVSFGRDGQTLASGSTDGTVRIWDLTRQRVVHTIEVPERASRSVAMRPDGTLLATAGADPVVRIWDVATGELWRSLEGHEDDIETVAFSPDGGRLATAGSDRTVRIWDLALGRTLQILPGHGRLVLHLAWSPDGTTLATTDGESVVRLWNTRDGRLGETYREPSEGSGFDRVTFSPDGRWLAYGGGGRGEIYLREMPTGKPGPTLFGSWNVQDLNFSPDNRRLVSSDADGTVRLWDVDLGQEIFRLNGHLGAVLAGVFSPEGDRLVTAGQDNTIRVWDTLPDPPR